MTTMLAVISCETLLSALFQLAIWGCIIAVLWWGLRTIAPPEPWMKVGTVVLVLLTVLVLINILLGLDNRAFIKF